MHAHCRVDIHHILSQEEGEWSGRRGKVNKQLLSEFLPRPEVEHIPTGAERASPARRLACVCGPDVFTECSVKYVDQNRGSLNAMTHPLHSSLHMD